MARGRTPLPKVIKKTVGIRSSQVNEDEPQPSKVPPQPPDWLSKEAKAVFLDLRGRIERMQFASEDHTDMLAICAHSLVDVKELSKVVQTEGRTYKTKNRHGIVMIKQRPEVRLLVEAMRRSQTLLAEFGLSPAAQQRVRVSAGKAKKRENGSKMPEIQAPEQSTGRFGRFKGRKS